MINACPARRQAPPAAPLGRDAAGCRPLPPRILPRGAAGTFARELKSRRLARLKAA